MRLSPPGLPDSRIAGLDVARGLAVLGMFVAHVLPDGRSENLADGRSSVLFATIAGISLGLLTGGPTPPGRGSRAQAVQRVALRAVFLVLLGLVLWTLGSGIAIILDYYGAFFLVLLPVLFAPRWVLGALALAFVTAATAVLAVAPDDPRQLIGGDLLLWLPTEWFVTGYYPGLVWLAYVLTGLLIARSDLRRRSTQAVLAIAGAVSALLGYGGAAVLGLDASAHSNTLAEALGAGGLAVAIVGVLSLITPPRAGVLRPLRDVGAMPLSIYTAQILVLALFRAAHPTGATDTEEWVLLAGLVVGSLLVAAVWRPLLGRGPLERVLARLSAPA
ncbi:acyltransferase family protein [Naasia aerilata]|uniref:Acyltransferase 3 domain-containing protein n=1 Tax=Naasia aerilata TaxID=1162966 RepID=A0ABM8GFI2_9MICO|nr:acyltransferase family protein [Naasia aerilata]BDZ47099.1 hypothetical protein GCM10025866_30080 [Naasia aerilata]